MLNTIALVLLVLWLIGFVMHIAGGIIHVLLVIAVVMFLINLVTGRRGRV
nr:lmo0937 family membrane protein [Aneurinibacillus tyrosinisolvens]